MTPDTIRESAREIPIAEKCDVCVLGGSCTGVFAAVAAAREGARVAIVEAEGFFGGVATAGLVNIWHSFLDTEHRATIIAGLSASLIERMRRRGVAETLTPPNFDAGHILNTEELKIELDALVRESKIRPFLHARFCDPMMDGHRVTAAIIEDKTGRRAIAAGSFIDATGDADLVARAQGAFTRNDDLQPPTTCVVLSGIPDVARATPGFNLGNVVFDTAYPEALRSGFLWSRSVVGNPTLTMVAGTRVHGADCSDADELTHAEMEGRCQARQIRDLLRAHFPEGDKVNIVSLPAYIGIRETRKAVCQHRLTTDEVLAGTRFDDAIANGSYRVDVHHSNKSGLTFRYLDGTEVYVPVGSPAERGRWRPETSTNPTFYQIPYRSLVPQSLENVLVAGRCIDTDRGAHGATRVMVNCNQMGEAAGIAAALMAGQTQPARSVDTGDVRKRLAAHGACVI